MKEIKDLIKRHHAATWERGFINPQTNLLDFERKINEEYYELRNAITEHLHDFDTSLTTIDGEIIHETIDLIAVCINMLKHFGVNFMTEYKKNVEYQESRI